MTRKRRQGFTARKRGYRMVEGAVHPDDKPPGPEPWITRKCQQGRHSLCPGCDCPKCHVDADLTGLRQQADTPGGHHG